MDLTFEPRYGLWPDYDRSWANRQQRLNSEWGSRIMTSIIAVWLTLFGPYFFRIMRFILVWLLGLRHDAMIESPSRRPSRAHTPGDAEENQRLLGAAVRNFGIGGGEAPQAPSDPPQDRPQNQSLRAMLAKSGSSRDFFWKCVKDRRSEGLRSWQIELGTCALMLVLFGLFVAYTYVVLITANVASNSNVASNKVGVSSSKVCGIWLFDDDAAGDEAGYRDDLRQRWKEERAGLYARNCYSNLDAVDTLACSKFLHQNISFQTFTRQKCPFSSSELCYDGPYSATTFDTGLIDAKIIGINAPETYKFRRVSTCSPLNMSEPYITETKSKDGPHYQYNYGGTENAPYTFNTSGDPFKWLVPSYSMNAYFASLYPDQDFWHPREGMQQANGSTLTIMFISSTHIYHIESSSDAIFNAQHPRRFGHDLKPYYYNDDPRARPLACADRTELCSPDGQKCWDMRSELPEGMKNTTSYWLMKLSLENSNTYKTIKWRLGQSLLAQRRLSQYVSLPLDPNQWELEASQMFAASLARIQYDTWSIDAGEDHVNTEYKDSTPSEVPGSLCGLYKMKTTDASNISLLAFILFILLGPLIWALSRLTEHKDRRRIVGSLKRIGSILLRPLKWTINKLT